jgi:hypothetical protein
MSGTASTTELIPSPILIKKLSELLGLTTMQGIVISLGVTRPGSGLGKQGRVALIPIILN